MKRKFVATICGTVCALAILAPPAVAMQVTHDRAVFTDTVDWQCPGADPVERFTVTSRSTTFVRDGKRVRMIEHSAWRGVITHRETGARIRDDGNWATVYVYRGQRVVRRVTTGSVWRLTVPGHGIVMHQTGRAVYDEETNDEWATPFGGFISSSGMCPYV